MRHGAAGAGGVARPTWTAGGGVSPLASLARRSTLLQLTTNADHTHNISTDNKRVYLLSRTPVPQAEALGLPDTAKSASEGHVAEVARRESEEGGVGQ